MIATRTRTRTDLRWRPLIVLAFAMFAAVTSEFLPAGLLLTIQADLQLSVTEAGLLVTAFAGTVMLVTAPLVALTARLSRRTAILAAMCSITLANVIATLAPEFGVLLATRILSGASHALLSASVLAYVGAAVPRDAMGRAVSTVAGGASLAMCLGIPLGAALAQIGSWRIAFGLVAMLAATGACAVAVLLPDVGTAGRAHAATPTTRRELRADRVDMVFANVPTFFIVSGLFCLYTYIAIWLTTSAGFDENAIPVLLVAFGVSGAVGLLIAGTLGDRYPSVALEAAVALSVAAVLIVEFGATMRPLVLVGLFCWGLAFGATPALLQARVMRAATERTRTLAGALQTLVGNGAVAFGSVLGGVVIDGAGVEALPFVAATWLAATLAAYAVVRTRRARRRRARATRPTTGSAVADRPHRGC